MADDITPDFEFLAKMATKETDHDGTIDYCAYCGGDLDTGWECNDCGTDWRNMAVLHDHFRELKKNNQPPSAELQKILRKE